MNLSSWDTGSGWKGHRWGHMCPAFPISKENMEPTPIKPLVAILH